MMERYIELSRINQYGISLTKDNLEYGERLKGQYKLFEPFAELVPMIEVRYYDGTYRYDGQVVALRYNRALMLPLKNSKDGKYTFCLPAPYRHRHLEYFRSKPEQPDRIGTPTVKKLEAWYSYLTTRETEQKAHVEQYLEKENERRGELAEPGSLVKWDNENKAVLEGNNLRYTVFFNPGAISTKIEIIKDYGIGLGAFLEMINHKPESTGINVYKFKSIAIKSGVIVENQVSSI